MSSLVAQFIAPIPAMITDFLSSGNTVLTEDSYNMFTPTEQSSRGTMDNIILLGALGIAAYALLRK